MWIQIQNKQRIINSDQIVDIFIDNTGKNLIADTIIRQNNFGLILGEYQDRDTCLFVLSAILECITSEQVIVKMPLGSEVDNWVDFIKHRGEINITT